MARDLATNYPDRRPGTPDARGAAAWFRRQLEPYGFRVLSDPFTATIDGRRTTLVNLVAEKRGIGLSPPEIIVMAHRDDSGVRQRAERQRFGHRGPHRAGAVVRADRRRTAALGPGHARLSLHRRRGRRRAGRCALRGRAAGTREDPRRRQPRLRRRSRQAPTRLRRRHVPLAGSRARRDPTGRARASKRRRAVAAERAPAAREPRLPLRPLRAGPVREPRHPGGDGDDRRRATPGGAGARNQARRHASRRHRPGGGGHRRRDGAGNLARAGPGKLRLPRPAADSRLGDRDRARRHAAALPRGRRRPLRPLSPPADPHRARTPQLSQPARLLGLGRRGLPLLRSDRPLGRQRRPCAASRLRLLAERRARRARPARGSRLARRAQPPPAATTDPAGGAARGSQRRAARTRRRRPPGGGDESVRAHLRPPLAARLALAARRCRPAGRRCARASSWPACSGRPTSSGRSPPTTGWAGMRRGTSSISSPSATRRCPCS